MSLVRIPSRTALVYVFALPSLSCSFTWCMVHVCSHVVSYAIQRPYVTPGYSYTGWSPPAQSNEASNGYEVTMS